MVITIPEQDPKFPPRPKDKNHPPSYSGPKVQSFLFSAPLFSQTNEEKRTDGAEKRTNGAEKRTNGAEKRTNGAEKRTNGAEKRTNGAEKRKCTLGPPYPRPRDPLYLTLCTR